MWKEKAPVSEQHTRERLLSAAEHIFAEKGFNGATVKEIADKAGVNVSLISYHFDGKEGVLKASVERFGREQLKSTQHILTAPESVEDMKVKLRLWVHQLMRCYAENRNVCSILHRENLGNAYLRDVFENIFLKAFDAVAKFFDQGKKKGIIRREINPALAATMIFSSVVQLGSSQEAQQDWMGISISSEKFRNQAADQFVTILFKGITE